MREIVVISGKGGTGKTSLTAAFAHLARNKVICDLYFSSLTMKRTLSSGQAMRRVLLKKNVRNADCAWKCADMMP